MLELILKITICHLIGDFVLQSDKMIKNITAKKLKSKYLYLHVFIHLILILVITGFEKQYILPALLLASIHLGIDIITKLFLKNKINSMSNFIIDQSLHMLSIALFIRYFYEFDMNWSTLVNNQGYLLIISLLCISFVSSIIIKKAMELFDYNIKTKGLKDAGKYIGLLERVFVFFFVITSFWEGIGFLLAAKSIFRFGDLKENKDVKLTEYILIGTLLSFGIAIIIAKVYLFISNII